MQRNEKLEELKALIELGLDKVNVSKLIELNNYFLPNRKETCGCKSSRIIQNLTVFWNTTGINEILNA
jgi:hypothetical protein